ncbi:MAG: hypothetical protein SFY95_09500 [Planctomycetota bacterium]|nr:hypothetical protein [Planctomycetota bacterium]
MSGAELLHILVPHSAWSPDADDASTLACAHAQSGVHHGSPVMIVGNADAERRAHLLGVRSWDRVCPAGHSTTLRSPSNEHGAAAIVRARGPRRLVAWGPQATQLARRLSARFDLPMSEISLAPSAEFPGFPARAPTPLGPREDLRAELGLEESDVSLAMADDPPVAGNATRLAFLAGLLGLADGSRRTIALAPRNAGLEDRARRFHAGARPEAPMLLLDAPTAVLWPAMDLAIITAEPPLPAPTLAHVSMLLAAGVPVVGPRDAGLTLLMGAEASRVLCAPATGPQAIASLLRRTSLTELQQATASLAPRLERFRAAFFDTLPQPPAKAPRPVTTA